MKKLNFFIAFNRLFARWGSKWKQFKQHETAYAAHFTSLMWHILENNIFNEKHKKAGVWAKFAVNCTSEKFISSILIKDYVVFTYIAAEKK